MTGTLWEEFWRRGEDIEWWETPAPDVLEFAGSCSPTTHPAVLDLGCGLGRHAIPLARRGFQVTATDSSPSAIGHLEEWAKRVGVSVSTRVCPMTEQGFPGQSFDVVLAYNVIYHGPRSQFIQAVAHVGSLLRPGGLFFFTSPTRQDGKYGRGRCVAPHTYVSPNAVIPGDMHYFADEDDFRDLPGGFKVLALRKDEGFWDNRGTRQFFSNWQVTARKL